MNEKMEKMKLIQELGFVLTELRHSEITRAAKPLIHLHKTGA